jgi:limonene-1,2-epoxide hydrolase
VRMRPIVLAVVVLLAAAGCGARASRPEDVVRAWSAALNSDDNDRAASLFARDAAIVQGGTLTHLRTRRDAVVWNARLPCSGRIVSLTRDGSAVTATFRLGQRKSRRCEDPPGAEAIALFVVEHGKIVLWDQLGSQVALGH